MQKVFWHVCRLYDFSHFSEIRIARSKDKVVSELTETKKIASAWERRLVENLRHAIMGEMVAMIAHQWKQPLTALLLNQDVLIRA